MRDVSALRLKARLLAALAALAIIAPLLAAVTHRTFAAPFSLVICTADGLVTITLDDEEPASPAQHAEREHCPACLRTDPALTAPQQVAPAVPQAFAAVAAQPPRRSDASPRAPPHARPDPTGPPSHT
jgi:hypothetical protein